MDNDRESSEGIGREDLKARVQRLTMVASNLFQRGSYETAFDSLMKAYLLDPTDPHVIACEQLLLPAWEMMKKRGTLGDSEIMKMNGQFETMLVSLNQNPPPGAPMSAAEFQKSTEEIRIEKLRQKKDLERKERERATFRDASRPRPAPPVAAEPRQAEEAKSQSGGLFAKLRQGKFLG